MALTRIDCSIFRGPGASIDTSAYTVLNPSKKPGSLVVACSAAVREGIGSQVACKLSLEHFVGGVLGFFDKRTEKTHGAEGTELSVEVLEAAFKNANSSVYEFGHKLAAGGRMAACLLGVVVQGDVVAAGRAGGGTAYLYRAGELFPFFERRNDIKEDSLVGSNSLVTVELASVPIEESDKILMFSKALDEVAEERLIEVLRDSPREYSAIVDNVVNAVFRTGTDVTFAMSAQIGPNAIYLHQPLLEPEAVTNAA